jgi:seryl-tRNA synthetase
MFWGVHSCFTWRRSTTLGIIKKYDIIDFELGNKIAGAGFLSTREKEHDYNEL